MMRLAVIHTYSSPKSAPHRTVLIQFSRGSLFAWVHPTQRPWLVRFPGTLCFGAVVLSFNIFYWAVFE